MAFVNPLVGLFIASLVNAVPSNESFHPCRASFDLVEADIAGSGREAPDTGVAVRANARDDDESAGSGRDWRAMAQRCRSLAAWHTGYSREVLLRRAEEYEQRAHRGDPPPARDVDDA
jgi:hypothetical protein